MVHPSLVTFTVVTRKPAKDRVVQLDAGLWETQSKFPDFIVGIRGSDPAALKELIRSQRSGWNAESDVESTMVTLKFPAATTSLNTSLLASKIGDFLDLRTLHASVRNKLCLQIVAEIEKLDPRHAQPYASRSSFSLASCMDLIVKHRYPALQALPDRLVAAALPLRASNGKILECVMVSTSWMSHHVSDIRSLNGVSGLGYAPHIDHDVMSPIWFTPHASIMSDSTMGVSEAPVQDLDDPDLFDSDWVLRDHYCGPHAGVVPAHPTMRSSSNLAPRS